MPMRSPQTLSANGGGPSSQRPLRTKRSSTSVRRMVARINANAASATHSDAGPGEFVTAMPSSRAASTSMPS